MAERIVVIQTCHLPQFIYAVLNLRRRNPEWRIDAIVLDNPASRALLERESLFESIRYCDAETTSLNSELTDQYDRIVFPLLNRGYVQPKLAAWSQAGRRAFSLNYRGELKPLSKLDWLLSFVKPLDSPGPGFVSFRRTLGLAPLSGAVLLLESDDPKHIERKVSSLPFKNSDTHLLRLESVLGQRSRQLLRDRSFQTVVVFLNQRPEYLSLQLLPLFLKVPRVIVSDDSEEFFETTTSGYRQLILRRLLSGAATCEECRRILLLQTEVVELTIKALDRLDRQSLFVGSRVTVVCRSQDAELFRSHPRVDDVIPFQRGDGWTGSFRLWRKIQDQNADVIAAVLTGRPVFRKQKLYYLLSTIRRHLVFNSSLDAYWLSLFRLPRLLKKDPTLSLPDVEHDVLFIQTEAEEVCQSAITRLTRDSRIVPNVRLTVFCREDKLPLFKEMAGVDRVLTYPRDGRVTLRCLRELLSERPDVVTAIFSGRPIFRKQKLLFFLLRASNRLIFNDALDCYYLNHKTFRYLLPSSGVTPGGLGPRHSRWFILPIKSILFLPRFFYLVIWITLFRLRRWYTARRRGVDFP